MTTRIPHADTEVRQFCQRIATQTKPIHDGGAVGSLLVGAGLNVSPVWQTIAEAIDHGALGGLAGDDHLQYHTDARAAVLHFLKTEHLDSTVGAADAGKPIKLNADGLVDPSMVSGAAVDHGTLAGLGDDDHTIYLLADGTRDLTGNLAVDAGITIDGRDISADGAALDVTIAIEGMVGVDVGATPGYLGAAAGDGVLRTSTGISYADGGNFVTLTTNDGEIVHDNLSGYDANDHIDHTGVSIATAATSGIAGGGTIAATRNLSLNINGLTGEAAIASADTLAFYDATAGAHRKITFAEFEAAFVTLSTADEKVAVDAAATPGYFGNASNDGVLRADGGIIWTDGGDYINLSCVDWTSATNTSNFETRGTLRICPVNKEVLLRDSAPGGASGTHNRLAIQGQTAGKATFVDIYTNDGDGTDDMGNTIFAKGSPTDWSAYEVLEFRYDASEREFAFDTLATGGGTVLPLNFYTEGHSGQLKLHADGSVTMNGTLTCAGVTSGENPGHTHTGTSLSGIDISADTNLAVSAPIVLTDDTLSWAHLGLESLSDPGGDRILFWDNVGVGALTWLTVSTGLKITTEYLTLDIDGLDADTIVAADTIAFWDATGEHNNKTSFTNFEAALTHNNLIGYDANRHIDHTAVSVIAGTGLSGGGTIAEDRTVNLDINSLALAAPGGGDTIAYYDAVLVGIRKVTFASWEAATEHDNLLNSHNRTTDLSKVGVDSGATAGYLGIAAGDGVLRTDASITWADGGDFVTLSCNPGLVDRGDPAAFDYFIGGGFTADGADHDLDLLGDGKIPSGCYAVYIRFIVQSTAVANGAYFFKKGITNRYNIIQITPVIANVKHEVEGIVFVDSNGKVTYNCNANVTILNMSVKGWFK